MSELEKAFICSNPNDQIKNETLERFQNSWKKLVDLSLAYQEHKRTKQGKYFLVQLNIYFKNIFYRMKYFGPDMSLIFFW